jgi:hypothetical protein
MTRYRGAVDVSTSFNAAAMRETAHAADRAHQMRTDRQRAASGHAAVDHGKSVTKAKDRRVKAADAVDPSAVYEKLQRQDTQHLIDIVT